MEKPPRQALPLSCGLIFFKQTPFLPFAPGRRFPHPQSRNPPGHFFFQFAFFFFLLPRPFPPLSPELAFPVGVLVKNPLPWNFAGFCLFCLSRVDFLIRFWRHFWPNFFQAPPKILPRRLQARKTSICQGPLFRENFKTALGGVASPAKPCSPLDNAFWCLFTPHPAGLSFVVSPGGRGRCPNRLENRIFLQPFPHVTFPQRYVVPPFCPPCAVFTYLPHFFFFFPFTFPNFWPRLSFPPFLAAKTFPTST